MNDFDNYIKREVKCKRYLRYVDDFVLFGNNFKYKKAKFLTYYEKQQGDVSLEEIKSFLSVQASFYGHTKHSNSYNLNKKLGEIDEQKYINIVCSK